MSLMVASLAVAQAATLVRCFTNQESGLNELTSYLLTVLPLFAK